MPRRSTQMVLAPHPQKERKVRASSGRGGLGNIIAETELTSDLKHESQLLRQRRMKREEESCSKYLKKQYTGRGGTGNIQSASTTQWITFDKSLDPDDTYEESVVERNKLSPKSLRTGRGGSGNNLLKPTTNQQTPGSGSSLLSLSSSSGSSSHLSRASFASSSSSSAFSHSPRNSESPIFSRFSKSKQQVNTMAVEPTESAHRRNQWWKFQRTNTPTPSNCSETPQITANDFHTSSEWLHEDTIAILETMERFEDDDDELILVPELVLQPRCTFPGEAPDEDELMHEDEDAEWQHNVLIQAQYEVSFHEL